MSICYLVTLILFRNMLSLCVKVRGDRRPGSWTLDKESPSRLLVASWLLFDLFTGQTSPPSYLDPFSATSLATQTSIMNLFVPMSYIKIKQEINEPALLFCVIIKQSIDIKSVLLVKKLQNKFSK